MKPSVLLLRIIHGLFAVYFIGCLAYLYISAMTKQWNVFTSVSLISLAAEGIFVFILNHGDCPLIHIQKRIGDPVPFFELIFPKQFAKKAIPTFAVLTIVGLVILMLRFIFL